MGCGGDQGSRSVSQWMFELSDTKEASLFEQDYLLKKYPQILPGPGILEATRKKIKRFGLFCGHGSDFQQQ